MRDASKGKDATLFDAENKEKMEEYALNDAKMCCKLWGKLGATWPEFEKFLSTHTHRRSSIGVRVNQEKLEEGMVKLTRIAWDAEQLLPWNGGDKPLSPKALAKECAKVGIVPPKSLAEDSEECSMWEAEHGDKYPWISAMRDYRKANLLLQKYKAVKVRIGKNGRACYSLRYHGAGTGRWTASDRSGSKGFNIQNQPRDSLGDCDFRSLLIPEPGHKFIIADFSQIEPRVMAWLCDDVGMLNKLAEGIPLYEAHARETMDWRGGNLKKENADLYALAKARVLGLGYGCGPDRFIAVAKIMAGIELTKAESERIVADFRAKNPKIVGLWRKLDSDFKRSGCMPDPKKRNFEIELPSGRVLRYFQIENRGREWFCKQNLGGELVKIYGAKLAENLVQGVARDVLGWSIYQLEKDNIPVTFHVHDEVVCEVPLDFDPSLVVSCMTTPPPWLEGCPLAVEYSEAAHYKK
jgi:DNA polymerase